MALLVDENNDTYFYVNSNYKNKVKLEEIYYNAGHVIIDHPLTKADFSTENLIGIHGNYRIGCRPTNYHILLMYTY